MKDQESKISRKKCHRNELQVLTARPGCKCSLIRERKRERETKKGNENKKKKFFCKQREDRLREILTLKEKLELRLKNVCQKTKYFSKIYFFSSLIYFDILTCQPNNK